MFAGRPGVETASAGPRIKSGMTAPDAEEGVDADPIAWVDVIFVMERAHRAKLNRRFRDRLRGKRVIRLDTSSRA